MACHESPPARLLRLASGGGSRYSLHRSTGAAALRGFTVRPRVIHEYRDGKLMAGSVNKVILVGNLGRDPEVRNMQSGGKVCNLSVATSERWRDKNSGEMQEKTEWHRVVVFDEKIAEVCERYLKKGSTVYLEGQLQTRKWTDQSGVEKYTTEVVLQRFRGNLVMLGGRGESGGGSGDYSQGGGDYGQGGGYSGGSSGGGAPSGGDLDDEIPF